jgi:hypothetical protein
MNAAMGGYFELELPTGGGPYHREALRFQSARAAFLALLESVRPPAVWAPWFLCGAMLEPLEQAGIRTHRYALDETLGVDPAHAPQPRAGEWLLYVNYFGICQRQVEQTLSRFGATQVVIDNAQGFFTPPPAGAFATLYSPRKFFGVADGGYLSTQAHVTEPAEIDDGTAARSRHLIQRLGAHPEPGYADFVAAEASLNRLPARRMSAATERLLACIPYEETRRRRAANFATLHAHLGRLNRLPLTEPDEAAPLCYPLLPAREDPRRIAELRETLRRERIYVPTYWPGVDTAADAPAFERSLPASLLALPCDQRVTSEQLARLIRIVIDRLDSPACRRTEP